MKLSFSIPTKSTSKPKLSSSIDTESQDPTRSNGIDKQFVTEFDSSKTLTAEKPPIIIPPMPNEYQPHKKLKNLFLLPSLQSSDSNTLSFELSTDGDADNSSMSYGLNVRSSGGGGSDDDGSKSHQQKQKHGNTENIMLEKLKYDLERLPEDQGFDEFKDVPVEGFGAALLAGYGWHEGRGIGRNAKEDVKVKQYTKRTDKEGIGFVASGNVSSNNNNSNNDVKSGDIAQDEQKERKRERNNGDGFLIGKDVRVIAAGRETYGVKGRIVEILDAKWVVLQIGESKEEVVKVRVSDIADVGSKEEEKCLRKLKALQLEINKKNKDNGKGATELSKERRESVRRESSRVKDEKIRWLRNHIRVRVISKDLKGGRFYLKKGEVVDVVGPYVCDISMDETNELIQGVDQDLLETALPRRGGPVLVLHGKHKGVYGNLVEKDLDRETGVVQDSDTREFVTVKLEQIAEYVGDPSYIGY